MDQYKMNFRPTSPTRPITPDCPRAKHFSRLGMWQKLQHFFGRDGSLPYIEPDADVAAALWSKPDPEKQLQKDDCSSARRIGIGLPRQTTFRRQNSEKRERLVPIEPCSHERRAISMSRPSTSALTRLRTNSVPSTILPTRRCASNEGHNSANNESSQGGCDIPAIENQDPADSQQPVGADGSRPPRPASVTSSSNSYSDQRDYFEDRSQLNRELDTKWILNLSMHFRDKSDREKFFVTYAETPSRWRRVTVSCDYRNAEVGSLEMDLKELQLQRDKSMQIYEAVRDSLADIKFYDSVTNLKLETRDGRLHVHVTEDVNEIIPYPPVSSLHHILSDNHFRPKQIRESELSFDAHLSGFVYKVNYKNRSYIKKEIPGPDTVDEFLYEVNALHALQDSPYVINLEAIITDESEQTIKGLLINYAEQGAIVDLLYDYKGEIAWEHRERWARHAIQGLSEIHEEGYVQGDFTLSNIVVDRDNNARIIDINRRGCPVGWEPPEIAKKIASNQRISMYIGQKSDLYQLGMTLWALAMDDDEPERHDPPLSTQEFPADVPMWYQEIVRNCLSVRPRDRLSATDLIKMFPPENHAALWASRNRHPAVRIKTEKRYIDPAAAVERDDLERFRDERTHSDEVMYSPESSRDDYTFTWPQSSNYDREYDSDSSEIERPRGRRRISDYDLELQAQRRREIEAPGHTSNESTDDESAPIISISSDGMETHLINADRPLPALARAAAYLVEEDDGVGTPISDLSLSLSGLPPLPDRSLFHGQSEISEDTPRNSTLQLLNTDSSSVDIDSASPATQRALSVPAVPDRSNHSESPQKIVFEPDTTQYWPQDSRAHSLPPGATVSTDAESHDQERQTVSSHPINEVQESIPPNGSVLSELTEVGRHPNVIEPGYNSSRCEMVEEPCIMTSSPPPLPFKDSGYDASLFDSLEFEQQPVTDGKDGSHEAKEVAQTHAVAETSNDAEEAPTLVATIQVMEAAPIDFNALEQSTVAGNNSSNGVVEEAIVPPTIAEIVESPHLPMQVSTPLETSVPSLPESHDHETPFQFPESSDVCTTSSKNDAVEPDLTKTPLLETTDNDPKALQPTDAKVWLIDTALEAGNEVKDEATKQEGLT